MYRGVADPPASWKEAEIISGQPKATELQQAHQELLKDWKALRPDFSKTDYHTMVLMSLLRAECFEYLGDFLSAREDLAFAEMVSGLAVFACPLPWYSSAPLLSDISVLTDCV